MPEKAISLLQVVMDARVEGDMEVSETEIVDSLNRCVSSINGTLSLKLPSIDLTEWMTNYRQSADGYRYDVCTEPETNNILLRNVFYPYIIYDFKRKAEQFQYAGTMYQQFNSYLGVFKAKYMSHVKPEYRTEAGTIDDKAYVPTAQVSLFPKFGKRRV